MTRPQFDEVITLVSGGVETGRGKRGAFVHHDAVNGELRGGTYGRIAALTSGGAIPETGDYRVVAEPDDTFIGTVNEDWAVESMAGDIFLLGTHSWQIRRVEPGVVRVRDAGDANPTVPFWMGEAPARTAELSTEVSELRKHVDEHLAAGDPDGARAYVIESTGLSELAATLVVDYLAVGRAVLGVMPTQEHLVLERFFDDTGGMQLVLHSPNGGRVNRALGLALRKKFCRTFNFELQAAATDDAVILSLGPHHSFPLEEVPRYVTSGGVEETLRQAILDSPMFLSRWRWNLNRALLILRFRNGRKNPPPIQRMEADDLMAALFPQAAACQENITGPIEIPDHVLVRQTINDTLHEALDVEGVRALLERMESGEVTVHCVDTTEASVLSHEIVTARPYAFLDDEEFQNRRTNAVQLRRGLNVDLSSIGALEPAAIEQVRDEVTPEPTQADDLHDLLSSLVLARARDEWRASWQELLDRGRGQVLDHEGHELWCTTERHDDARQALRGEEPEVAAALRGHLEISGVTTVERLAEATTLSESRVERRSGRRSRTTASRCRVATPAARPPSGWPAGCSPGCTRTPAAPVGTARGPSPPRTSCGSCSGGSTSRRAPSWPVRPGCSPRSTSCRASKRPRWRGSRSCSPAGCGATRPGCSTSCATRARSAGCGSRPDRATTPTRRSVSPRRPRRSRWCSAPTRRGCSKRRAPASTRRSRRSARRSRSSRCSANAGPASRPSSRTRPTGCPKTSSARCGTAWRAACSPRTASVRCATRSVTPASTRPGGSPACCAGAQTATVSVGRWSLVPATASGAERDAIDRDELAEAVAELLLRRWGVIFRDLAVHDSLSFPWRDLQWALRRLEDRGLVRGGRFVSGLHRRAVRVAGSGGAAEPRDQAGAVGRAGHGERDGPVEPGRDAGARGHGAGGADQSGDVCRRGAGGQRSRLSSRRLGAHGHG